MAADRYLKSWVCDVCGGSVPWRTPRIALAGWALPYPRRSERRGGYPEACSMECATAWQRQPEEDRMPQEPQTNRELADALLAGGAPPALSTTALQQAQLHATLAAEEQLRRIADALEAAPAPSDPIEAARDDAEGRVEELGDNGDGSDRPRRNPSRRGRTSKEPAAAK